MSSRRWVLVASERALDRPYSTAPEDQLLELLDRLGELGERRETTPLGPGQPADQQAPSGGEVAGLEDRPQLLL